jgi:hypothetical protein
MASSINYASIDNSYPIAGQDNDSQGFRDNFGYIKNSLQSAKSEIEDLQLNTAKTNANNNFNFQQISQAAFIDCGESIYDGTTVNVNTLIDYAQGSLQIFQVTDSITFTLSNFPTSNTAGRLRIQLTADASHAISFAVNAGTLLKNTGTTNPVGVTSSGTYIIDFWTYDHGLNVFMNNVGHFV